MLTMHGPVSKKIIELAAHERACNILCEFLELKDTDLPR